ncbi:hypothetical protein MMC15_001672 [Xylographa vitiligo]|nr:hypothetical protein [Xylographa vitiligo]
MSYLSSQSGGGWVPLSLATSNLQTTGELLEYWLPQIDRCSARKDTKHAATLDMILKDVREKAKAGFNVSAVELLGRVVGYELAEAYRGGVNTTFSSVTKLSNFEDAKMPFPILEVSEVIPSDKELYGVDVPDFESHCGMFPKHKFSLGQSILYDMTPFEFVAWLGSTKAFTAMEFLGTRVENGRPVNQSACVKGFDSIEQVFAARFCCTSLAVRRSFLLGTTAQAFVSWYIEDKSDNTQDLWPRRSILHGKAARDGFQAKSQLTRRIVSQFPADEVDGVVAAFKTYFNLSAPNISYAWVPNPFRGNSTSSESKNDNSNLRLVDITELGSSLPLAGHSRLMASCHFCGSKYALPTWPGAATVREISISSTVGIVSKLHRTI